MTAEDPPEPAPLHVLEVVGNAVVGGMERHVQLLVEGLLGQGLKVTALSPFESDLTTALRALGCPVYIAALEEEMQWRSLLTATELIRRRRIDLVHTHLLNATFLGSVAASLSGVPVAITVHGMYINPEEIALARLTKAHLLTVCTAAYDIGLALGVPEEQISLVPNGVDTEQFHPSVDGSAFRGQLGVPDDAPLVGMVGRLSREKGPDLFLQAAAQVAAAHPEAHFALVGDGPLRYDVAREAKTLGLGERVHLPGLVGDTRSVYPALDVVCLPSRVEGQPLALLEAMSAARPVVAMTVGGVPEMVQMGQTGWLVAHGDVTSFSERIVWLLDHPEQGQSMGQEGRKRVLERFDARMQTAVIKNLFQRLSGGRRLQARASLRLSRAHSGASANS